MIISAAIRPRGLKRGVSDLKLAKMLGFKEAVGLADICGRIELSAEDAHEFFFLRELYNAVTPCSSTKSAKIVVDINGEQVASYTYGPDKTELEVK